MSPDRTIAALRRELYIRKPEVFKMACLRDIKSLFGPSRTPFYAGFGNRLTDALSYRSVSIPSNRIFTINSNAEVSLDLLSLNKLRYSYVNMREVVDHYFPPVNTLVKGGGEEYTDFTYWRDPVLDLDDFSASESGDGPEDDEDNVSEDGDANEDLADSYISRDSIDDEDDDNGLEESMLSGSADEDDPEHMTSSMIEADFEDADHREHEGEGEEPQEDDTQAIDLEALRPAEEGMRDVDAETISGLTGLSLERKASEVRKV